MVTLADNKRATHDYDILEKLQAGLVLNGQEVKSIKSGRISLAGSYIIPKGDELFLTGSTVPPWQPKNAPDDYNPERDRKLLLQRQELNQLLGKAKERGLTFVPLKVYTVKGQVKLELGIAKGKKKQDKREKLKKQDVEREMQRALKSQDFF
mgnify:CR=1 FL=1